MRERRKREMEKERKRERERERVGGLKLGSPVTEEDAMTILRQKYFQPCKTLYICRLVLTGR
jgi:hypothetical protein